MREIVGGLMGEKGASAPFFCACGGGKVGRMSENKIIKTTVVADTSSYRKGMQDAAKETDDFARKAQGAAAPARELGAALESTAQASKEAATSTGTMNASLDGTGQKWRRVSQDVGSFVERMREAAGAQASAALGSEVLGSALKGTVEAAGLVSVGLGLVATSAATVGVAMAAGARETAVMQLALDATSNYSGQTVVSMRAAAAAMAESGRVTIGTAKEVTTQLVSSGKIGQGAFDSISASAADFARVTGTEVSKVGPELVKLFEDPAKGAEQLNERMHFLTVSEIEQIKTLQEMGRMTEAQTLLSEKLNEKLATIPENLGTLEKAWRGVGNMASWAWDKMMSAGREKTTLENIQEVAADIERGSTDAYVGAGGAQGALDRLLKQQVAEYEKSRNEAAAAEQNARNQQAQQLVRATSTSYKASEIRSKIALVESMTTEDTTQATQKLEALKALNKELDDLLNPKEKKTRAAKVHTDDDRVLGDWQRRVSLLDAEAAGTEKLTATEQAYVSVLSDVTAGRVKMTTAARARFATLASEALALEQTQIQEKEAAKAAEEHAKWINALWQAEVKETARLEEGLKKEEERVAALGQTKEAVNQLAAAQLEEAAAAKEVEAANLKAASAFAGEFADAYKRAADAALRQAEILRQTAGKKLEAANREAQIETQKGWEKISDSVGQAVTNALVQGGSSGIEMLKRAFKATVFQALVQPVVQQGTQAVMQLVGGGTGGGMGGSSGLGSLNSLVSAGSSAAGLGGSLAAYQGAAGYLQFGSMASSFGTGLTAAAGGADLSAAIAAYEAAGMGATASSLGAGASAAGAVGAEAAGLMGSMMSGLATAAPYLAVAMLVAQQLGAFKGPTYHHGGAYMASTDGTLTKANNSNLTDFNLGWGAYTVDRSTGYDDAMLTLSQGLAKQIDDSIKAYGGKSSGALTVGSRFASDNDDWSEGAIRIVNEAGEKVYDFTKRYTSDANKALQQFGEDSTRALLATLQQTDLSDEFDALFKGIDPLKASIGEINAVMQQATAIQQQISTVKNAVDSAFLTPAEQMQKAFDTLGVSAPKTVSEYQALVAAQDLNTAAGRELAVSLMSLYPQFQQLGDAVANQAAGLQQQIWQLTGNTAAMRAAELEKIDPANRALQERVWQLQDEQAASQAAAAAASSMAMAVGSAEESFSSLASALRGAVDAMTDETEAYQEISRKRAQAQLETALAIAKASGGAVLPKLEDISGALQVLQQSSAGQFGSREDYLRDRYRTANVVASLGAYVPGFASGGDHLGGLRIVGEYGPELESTGPSRIVSNSQARSLLSMDEVAEELRALRADMRAAQVEIARTSAKTARVLEKWDVNGMPGVEA